MDVRMLVEEYSVAVFVPPQKSKHSAKQHHFFATPAAKHSKKDKDIYPDIAIVSFQLGGVDNTSCLLNRAGERRKLMPSSRTSWAGVRCGCWAGHRRQQW